MKLAEPLKSLARRRWLLRGVGVAGALVVLFGAFGTFVLPGLIKSQAEKAVGAKLHRTLTMEAVKVHPFSLRVEVAGLKLMEPDGRTVFASLQQLQVQASASSLFHLAPVIRQVRLAGPFVHVSRVGPNRYSFDDIVAALAESKRQAPPAPAGSAAPARFSVYNIQVEAGRIEFDDLPQAAHHTVADLKVGIPFISSLPSQEEVFVEPLLSAVINGAPLAVKGRARPFADPKEAVVDLDLDGVDLPAYLKYLPFDPKFRLPSARLDLHLQASFKQPSDRPASLTLKGRAAVKSLVLTGLDDKPLIRVPELSAELASGEPLAGRFALSKVALTGIELDLARDARHALNLMSILPADARAAPDRPAAAPAAEHAAAGAPAASIQVSVDEIAIQDASVRLVDRDPARPMEVSVEHFGLKIASLALDPASRRLRIGSVGSDSAQFKLQQGVANGEAAAAQAVAPPRSAPEDSKPAAAGPGASPFEMSIDQVTIANWTARIESRGLPQAAVTTVSGLSLSLQGLSTAPGGPGSVELKAAVNQKGALSVVGAVGLTPLHADLKLDLKGVDLLALQPYVTDRVNLLVTRADLSAKGHLVVDQGADAILKGGFQGEFTLGNLATIDKVSANDFLDWKSLHFGGVDLRLAPLAVNIEQIALSEFFARIIIDPSGRINLQDIVRGQADRGRSLTDAEAASAQAPAPPASAAQPKPSQSVPPIRIGAVALAGGNVRFTDNFIRPNYSASLADLGGTVSGLSSQADSAATVDVHGQVNGAPLTIAGRINPIKGDLFVDLKAGVHGMELAPLSPYSGKYVGYGIERGKLSFDVAYKLEQRKLSAENRLVLDQLTFGDKVESPTATKLPVQLAVALLKDRNGVIDVNLPIGGSLDDPKFSVGGVIVQVIVNLVTKAITSPFALLGSLFGGGEELSYVAFDPGLGDVTAAQESRLNSLAKALAERPGLKLQIGAQVDPGADRAALARQSLQRRVRALKVKDLVAKGESATVETVSLTTEEYAVLLKRAYEADHPGKPAGGPQGAAPDYEGLLLATIQVGDGELTALGDHRAQAVKQWLQASGQVEEPRMFLVATRLGPATESAEAAPSTAAPAAAAPAGRVEFSLK